MMKSKTLYCIGLLVLPLVIRAQVRIVQEPGFPLPPLRRQSEANLARLSPQVPKASDTQRVLGAERLVKVDVVRLQGGGRLEGTLLDDRLRMRTAYGLFDLPMKALAAFERGSSGTELERIVTNAGERYTGFILKPAFRFQLADGGEKISLRKEGVERIILRASEFESESLNGCHLISLRNGDSFRGSVAIEDLLFIPQPRSLPIDLSRVATLIFREERQAGLRLFGDGGDLIDGFLAEESVSVTTQFGGTLDLFLGRVSTIDFLSASEIGLGHSGAVQSIKLANSRFGLSIKFGLSINNDSRPGLRISSVDKNSPYRGFIEGKDRIVAIDQQPLRRTGFPDPRKMESIAGVIEQVHRSVFGGRKPQAFITVDRGGIQLVFRIYRALDRERQGPE